MSLTSRWFRTPLVCSLITGFACEASTTLDELADLASHVLNEDIHPHQLMYANSGVRNRCMAKVLTRYPSLPSEVDIIRCREKAVAKAIRKYGESIEL